MELVLRLRNKSYFMHHYYQSLERKALESLVTIITLTLYLKIVGLTAAQGLNKRERAKLCGFVNLCKSPWLPLRAAVDQACPAHSGQQVKSNQYSI